LIKMEERGDFIVAPSREVVLDRETQHLNICPDSQDTVANCKTVQKCSTIAVILLSILKIWASCLSKASFGSCVNAILKPTAFLTATAASALSFWSAGKLRREFFFKYKASFRDRDLLNIPKVWRERE
jgi:hypothetical protein